MVTNNSTNTSNPISVAQGGTNATSMATSTGIVKYDGTRLVTSSTALIDSSNRFLNASQPAFKVYRSSAASNVTGDGTAYVIVWDTELVDQGSNFSSTAFTAPVTGLYQFNATVWLSGVGAGHTTAQLYFTCSSTADLNYICYNNPFVQSVGASYIVSGSCIMSMAASATCTVTATVSGSTKTVSVFGQALASGTSTFSGCLLC